MTGHKCRLCDFTTAAPRELLVHLGAVHEMRATICRPRRGGQLTDEDVLALCDLLAGASKLARKPKNLHNLPKRPA